MTDTGHDMMGGQQGAEFLVAWPGPGPGWLVMAIGYGCAGTAIRDRPAGRSGRTVGVESDRRHSPGAER